MRLKKLISLIIKIILFPLPKSRLKIKLRLLAFQMEDNMPLRLLGCQLFLNEENISHGGISGRPDQVYQTKRGELVIVDTKSHKIVTLTDQIQLSLYAFILSRKGFNVSSNAYIRYCDNNFRVKYKRIPLLSPALSQELLNHYY
ncbi:hypothetical protein ABT56_22455 [Photobacterium aquae]|uniref:PD-(D/E)XK endonuclease-like domain-containing protein n=1 Tax=Photobacterium aquae TaxID=1195763 RepID=A0A0J1GMB2_9GAMM|nr:PD-(D/E)XK nuclease family protein [Photobacterium aquae]KLV00875.1 hypothetical protein ABT56_22455 [Photobacterium aquae]